MQYDKGHKKITPEKFPDLKHKDIYIHSLRRHKVIPEEKNSSDHDFMILQTKNKTWYTQYLKMLKWIHFESRLRNLKIL